MRSVKAKVDTNLKAGNSEIGSTCPTNNENDQTYIYITSTIFGVIIIVCYQLSARKETKGDKTKGTRKVNESRSKPMTLQQKVKNYHLNCLENDGNYLNARSKS